MRSMDVNIYYTTIMAPSEDWPIRTSALDLVTKNTSINGKRSVVPEVGGVQAHHTLCRPGTRCRGAREDAAHTRSWRGEREERVAVGGDRG